MRRAQFDSLRHLSCQCKGIIDQSAQRCTMDGQAITVKCNLLKEHMWKQASLSRSHHKTSNLEKKGKIRSSLRKSCVRCDRTAIAVALTAVSRGLSSVSMGGDDRHCASSVDTIYDNVHSFSSNPFLFLFSSTNLLHCIS